jgi:hypothetical protein
LQIDDCRLLIDWEIAECGLMNMVDWGMGDFVIYLPGPRRCFAVSCEATKIFVNCAASSINGLARDPLAHPRSKHIVSHM